MFDNNSSSRQNEKNVNTRGIAFKNKEGFFPSTLVVGGWNENVSLKIHPALDPSQQTQTKVYNYEASISTALSTQKALLLYKKIEEIIIPAIKSGENKTVAVDVMGNNLIVVGSMYKGSVHPFIGILRDLDPNTKLAKNSMYYEFNNTFFIEDYNVETGEFKTVDGSYEELELFVILLKSYVEAMTNGQTHSYRNVEHFFKENLNNNVKKLCEVQGISTGNGFTSNYRNQNSGSIFANGNNEGGNGFSSMSQGIDEELPFTDTTRVNGSVDDISKYL